MRALGLDHDAERVHGGEEQLVRDEVLHLTRKVDQRAPPLGHRADADTLGEYLRLLRLEPTAVSRYARRQIEVGGLVAFCCCCCCCGAALLRC